MAKRTPHAAGVVIAGELGVLAVCAPAFHAPPRFSVCSVCVQCVSSVCSVCSQFSLGFSPLGSQVFSAPCRRIARPPPGRRLRCQLLPRRELLSREELAPYQGKDR
eukprot:scaffold6583_cov75-Phaeocystis_antarctica.AAC.1